MKKIFTLLSICLTTALSFGQVGAVASDFTQTDLDGTSHTLYDYLDAGKIVIVDMSATWCGPCWSFHQAHYLQDLYTQFGPDGTNEVVIIFYEDDVNTTLADLQGTGGSTQGDWVTGVPYTIIDATAALPAEYGTGYPTVSVICPTDKKIKSNLTSFSNIADMKANVQGIINNCSSVGIEEEIVSELSIYPNPVTDISIITVQSTTNQLATLNVYNMTGQLVLSTQQNLSSGANSINLDMSTLESGSYVLNIDRDNLESIVQKVIKR
jgi:thiol-disulfide isomerase/thioredoxin